MRTPMGSDWSAESALPVNLLLKELITAFVPVIFVAFCYESCPPARIAQIEFVEAKTNCLLFSPPGLSVTTDATYSVHRAGARAVPGRILCDPSPLQITSVIPQ